MSACIAILFHLLWWWTCTLATMHTTTAVFHSPILAWFSTSCFCTATFSVFYCMGFILHLHKHHRPNLYLICILSMKKALVLLSAVNLLQVFFNVFYYFT